MKQFYYTACKESQSVNGRSGFQVRAVTGGLSAAQLEAAVRYAGYQLPKGMNPETRPDQAPVRLALLQTKELGRILCHSVYVGKDPTTERFGNYFSHIL